MIFIKFGMGITIVTINLNLSMRSSIRVTTTQFFRSDVKDFRLKINKNNLKILELKKTTE